MTPMKEDYLKIIFELGGTKNKVSNKQIANSLDIAAGSVTEMVSKLVEDGLATHTPYAGIALTDEGVEVAEQLVRRHRIWETFLVDKLHYKLSEVHTDAEQLEHVNSEKIINDLDAFLGHPKHCPHGGVIPTADGYYPEYSHVQLSELKDGDVAVVDRLADNRDLLTYLDQIDFDLGDRIKIIGHAPFEGPIKVQLLSEKEEDTIREVSFKASHYVFVQPEK
ncbi:metal-dependent transcriptional regulator [Pediococcus claussenii]|uniref:Manganese transport regulator n=1 Tax=Pediococcus claussenii (strain ATCC BAA-344 / DSM 14800 / JCM 18046 / KCTC 3811 / LMG 21948 / P06) TaxID=701521 RepID=G8PE73_PEDCP|nr:metal-dependent transcriptional regulator [Pediococcus claussenii]AEV95558.1 metalloregulator ScaR [Pediococcus claussenii ATCC BAA-344]ANZ69081.1 Cro/Cl family transcriptional regulator [Pediococcus claussenii]ANZ70897.1 Cro/Cl family transcriptional regulator [Pediococcus claussenii]KRN20208.1 scaR protein [Pediococcus claussenii]